MGWSRKASRNSELLADSYLFKGLLASPRHPSHGTDTDPLQGFWIVQFLFAFSSTALKFSILALLHRIFGVSRSLRVALLATGAFQIAWFIAQVVSVLLSCRPFAYFWDKTIPHGHCINENNASYAITATNLLSDLVIFFIPIFPLWGLQKSAKQRLGLIGLFLGGAL